MKIGPLLMSLYWASLGPPSNVTGVLIQRINLNRDIYTKRLLCEHEFRDCSDTPRTAEDYQQMTRPAVRGEARNTFSPIVHKRSQHCQHLDLGHLVSRTVRQYVFV